MDNTNYLLKAVSFSNQILKILNENILKEGEPIIILEGYDWLREVFSLLAKQSNLFESCTLLLENNMEKEAYILARSQFNNMLWISYICNDNTRAKKYFHEALITHLQQLKKIKDYLRHLPLDTPHLNKFPKMNSKTINSEIKKINNELKKAGYETNNPQKPLKNISVFQLTERDPSLFGLYVSFYHEASRLEHSDILTMAEYRKPVVDDISKNIAFTFDLSESNIDLWKTVYKNSLLVLFKSIERIHDRIKETDSHLFEQKVFNEEDFCSIIIIIKAAYDFIDSIE